MGLFDILPRYKEAVDYENQLRTISFLPVHEYIQGIQVVQFTPIKYLLLDSAKNPFVCGGTIEPTDLIQFIWAIHPDYGQSDKRNTVTELCTGLDYKKTIEDINKYLDESFIDSMEGNPMDGDRIPYYSWVASLVDVMASEYGWAPEVVLNMPFKQIYQYMKIINERKTEKVLFNPYSDRIKDECMNELNAKKD